MNLKLIKMQKIHQKTTNQLEDSPELITIFFFRLTSLTFILELDSVGIFHSPLFIGPDPRAIYLALLLNRREGNGKRCATCRWNRIFSLNNTISASF